MRAELCIRWEAAMKNQDDMLSERREPETEGQPLCEPTCVRSLEE